MGISDVQEEDFTFQTPDGKFIFVRKWNTESSNNIKAAVQLAHGMMEHSYRYRPFAQALAKAGYVVYANDHRGHGLTAASPEEIGSLCENGFSWMVEDMHQLNRFIQERHGDLPVFLFGHSMGSFLVQKFMSLYGSEIHGAVLSGTSGKPGPIINIGIWLARLEAEKKGMDWRSKRLHKLVFGGYNKQFVSETSEFAWLSRDKGEVDAYIADPFCGQLCTSQFYYEFFKFLKGVHTEANLKAIPRDLPIFIVAGDRDPVGRNGKGIHQLLQLYRKVELINVSCKLYQNGRHELLHELNRDEVIQDVISWLQETERKKGTK